MWLIVENNSKFVRGKKKAREAIESEWRGLYDMQKKHPDGHDYVLKVSYESDDDLEEMAYDIMSDAQSNADLKNCFIDIDITHKESGKDWS